MNKAGIVNNALDCKNKHCVNTSPEELSNSHKNLTCGDGTSDYINHHPSSRGYCTRRLREYGERAATCSVLLLISTATTIRHDADDMQMSL
ncbi:jg21980, partial [Pararge aegeria aegeria]